MKFHTNLRPIYTFIFLSTFLLCAETHIKIDVRLTQKLKPFKQQKKQQSFEAAAWRSETTKIDLTEAID